jgi:hypothetical protein
MTGRLARLASRVAAAGVAAVLSAAVTALAPAPSGGGAPRWHVVKTFAPHNTLLYDVIGFRDGTVWAGGESPATMPLLFHLTGKTWHTVSLPGSAGTFVANLSASSPVNVWAALANEPVVARLTLGGWSTTTFAVGSDALATDNVVTFGPKNTWVFAYDFTTMHPFAEHFDGTTWTSSALPLLVDCDCQSHEVSASSPNNIWAWVYDAKINGFATMRFDGHHWQVIKLPAHLLPAGHSAFGEQILAESPSNVWATAVDNKSPTSIVLLHWNGHTWAKIGGKLPKGGELIGPIAADGSGGLWMIGRTPAFTEFILHYAKGRWTRSAVPSGAGGPLAVQALRLIGGTQTVLGVADISFNSAEKGAAIIEYGR